MAFLSDLFSKTKTSDAPETLIAEVLIREGIINDTQLSQAIEHQQAVSQGEQGPQSIAKVIVDMGLAKENDVLNCLNSVYGIDAKSVSEDLEALVDQATQGGLLGRIRIPIRVKISLALSFFLLLTMFVLSYFMLNRQAENLYTESVKAGKVSLAYFTNEAKIPLLNDDTLRLNSIINEVTSVEGLVYAVIVDKKNTVQAHNDISQVGRVFTSTGKTGQTTTEGNVSFYNRELLSGERILNLSSPITFKDKILGTVNVGISLDFIDERIAKEKFFIYMMTVIFFLAGMVVAGLLGASFSRPISKLVVATKEISSGNYQHKLNLKRKDEFSDLANAFNFMSHELWLKSIMRESFGRYVSTTIRDLILADPESMWLKGVKNEATIVFADVRGFTKYSEVSDPEVVVEQLNEFFDIAAKHIEAHDGYIDKFIGDEVLAVFGGLPDSTGDHATNALTACWEMQRELDAIGSATNPLLARVGASINTGDVVSGNIGSDVRMEYTVIGDTVNVASRLNALAGAGNIVISESTFERVKGIAAVAQLQPQMVKGKAKPLQPYQVVKLHGDGDGPPPPPTPFAGDGVAAPPAAKTGPVAAAPPPPKTQPAPPAAAKTAAAKPASAKPTNVKPASAKKEG